LNAYVQTATWEPTALEEPSYGDRESGEPISEYVAKSSGSDSLNRFLGLERDLAAAKYLSDGWNSYNAPAPSAGAIDAARQILTTLKFAVIVARKVLASAEGGVSIIFTSATGNGAVIESSNEDGVSLVLYDAAGDAHVLDWPEGSLARGKLLLALKEHLQGAALAAS
jgi:hypothetical protein